MDNSLFDEEVVFWESVSIEDIKNNIDKIDSIIINGSVEIDDELYEYNTKEKPITYTKLLNKGVLSIDREYYLSHKEEIDGLIQYICLNRKKNSISIKTSELVNSELIKAISENHNICRVFLGTDSSVYSLKKEDYDVLKNNESIELIETNNVDDELKDNYDSIISFNNTNKIFGNNTYYDLKEEKVYLYEPISNSDFKNCKYISPSSTIIIHYDDYNNVLNLLNVLKENNQTNKVILSLNEKDKCNLNKVLFENLDVFKDINILIGLDSYTCSQYYEYERYLYSLIEPAMDLSPFEKYLYAYNITKKYKEYNENEESKIDSRNLYKLLGNDYMVCVGFSHLLVDLLKKLGIESYEISSGVDIGFDNVKNDTFNIPDDVSIKKGNHARVRVRLVDSKYNIDGMFIADPTWDNNLNKDSYLFCLMTAYEYDNMYRKNYISLNDNEILFSSYTIEEFYERVNYLLDNNNYKDDIVANYSNFIRNLMEPFNILDKEFFKKINDSYYIKFKNIVSYIREKDSKIELTVLFNKIIEEIGYYIISKNNNIITGKTFESGIRKLYTDFYGYDSDIVEEILNETMEYNKHKYNKAFPSRKEKLSDGSIQDGITIENKFDIEYQKVA